MNHHRTGVEYEEKAAAYLEAQGYTVLARNYRNRYGELDLIAEKGAVIVYCEVKYRSSGRYGGPFEAVGEQKQKRICRVAALHYAQYGAPRDLFCRFDVIGFGPDGQLRHIENAFEYQDSI